MLNDGSQMRYVDMCIWVDANAYKENVDETVLYEYIRLIIDTQAKRKRLFKTSDDYMDFSIYFATKVFMRYRNKKQDNIDSEGNREMELLKSVSNYVKNTIYFNKLLFLKEVRGISTKEMSMDRIEVNTQLRDALIETMDRLKSVEFSDAMHDCASTARKFVSRIPYKTNSVEWHRIYMSCLLTLMNYLTLAKSRETKVKNSVKDGKYDDRCINAQYQRERLSGVKLYRLNDNMSQYIFVLTNKIMKAIAKDLTDVLDCYVPADDIVDAVIHNEVYGCEDED